MSKAIDGDRRRVWVVDDSPLQAESCRSVLALEYEARVFLDGPTMLEALGSGPAPDLLVIDWYMPDLSGLEVCRFVRERLDAARLPILILTAAGNAESVVEAFAAGANDFVMKPFSATELKARVAALIRTKQLHVRLGDAEQKLRIEAEFRETFIGMLAHDLRQPLSTFMLTNHALEKAVTPASAGLLDMQKRAAARMTGMVAELLDFTRSRPESGMPIEPEGVDLEPVARAIVDEMRVSHPDRAFRLTVDGACSGHWDRDRLAQVCSNLLTNAVEHSSPSSPIDIGVSAHGDEVQLTVSNQGPPIPAAILPNIFKAFRRGGRTKKGSSGLGLGLHIVSEIVRAHRGTVAASSDERATTFSVTLPRVRAE